MSRYKHTDLEDDASSMGSVQLNEGISSTATHIRYHTRISLWKSRSKLEKILIILVGILVFLVFLLITILSSSGSDSGMKILHIRSHNKGEVCLTPNCVKSAAHLISSLDLRADPCEDFYQYSCGGWVAENPVPDGKSIWGTFGKLEQQNQLIIKHILGHGNFRKRLYDMTLVDSPLCLDCGSEDTATHAFWECPEVRVDVSLMISLCEVSEVPFGEWPAMVATKPIFEGLKRHALQVLTSRELLHPLFLEGTTSWHQH